MQIAFLHLFEYGRYIELMYSLSVFAALTCSNTMYIADIRSSSHEKFLEVLIQSDVVKRRQLV